ncbi:MAG: putative glycoside hydrolase [Leptospiraceae bacterium]
MKFRSAFMILLMAGLSCTSAAKEETPPEPEQSGPLRGIYLDVNRGRNLDLVRGLIERGKPVGLNYVVVDVQPYASYRFLLNPEVMQYLKSQGIYVTGRVVCFQDGLTRKASDAKLKQLYELIEKTAAAGFDEVQLDYIRFADDYTPYSRQQKYDYIEEILKEARAITDRHNAKLGADVFGRVVYNRDDLIGQKLENFAKYVDVIYPMLYPSHFTGDRKRLSNPGFTIHEGTTKGLDRLKGTRSTVQPFIQAFGYNVGYARMSYKDYIIDQILAAEKTDARGWVAWNARAEYETLFQALEEIEKGQVNSSPEG